MKKVMKAVAALMLMVVVVITAGCKKTDDPSNPTNGGNNGGGNGDPLDVHEYVDLGLPSGTLWATCNVGANSPEEYGDYFAWGETTPKVTCNWSNYKYSNGSCYQLTKYCFNPEFGDNGFADNLTVLQYDDDAATVNWGEGWCTPDRNQWIELLDNTKHTWTIQNGVNGCLITASNGNNLFLPAAGRNEYDGIFEDGSDCYFWTSWLINNYENSFGIPSEAWNYHFWSNLGDDEFSTYAGNNRAYGFSVRPVRSKGDNGNIGGNGTSNGHDYVDLGLPSGTLWATCDLGATEPESPGDCYAWGETTSINDNVNWTNYIYCSGSANTLTKYCCNSEYGFNGFTDNLIVLQSDDDAATVNWGDDWVMPTIYQWLELIQYTTKTRISNDDEYEGYLLTASNGNSLYLVIDDRTEEYWSSSLCLDRPNKAYGIGIDVGFEIKVWDRCWSNRVRPVRSPK